MAVVGGTLQGTPYEAVSDDRLRKVAKRYNGDAAFQKYARAYVILSELDISGEPRPCEPLVAKGTSKEKAVSENRASSYLSFCAKMFSHCVQSKWTICLLLCLTGSFLLRPSISHLFGKVTVSLIRLIFRRVLAICSMLLDGVVDEVVYQLDHTVTAVLPDPGISQEVPGPSKFMAHLFSGLVGAAVAVLAGQRRAQIQV